MRTRSSVRWNFTKGKVVFPYSKWLVRPRTRTTSRRDVQNRNARNRSDHVNALGGCICKAGQEGIVETAVAAKRAPAGGPCDACGHASGLAPIGDRKAGPRCDAPEIRDAGGRATRSDVCFLLRRVEPRAADARMGAVLDCDAAAHRDACRARDRLPHPASWCAARM